MVTATIAALAAAALLTALLVNGTRAGRQSAATADGPPRPASTAKPSPAAPTRPPGAEIVVPHLKPIDRQYDLNGTAGVTLTFDDGPDPIWTPKVLAVLREHKAHAVFCMVGFRVRENPDLVRQIARAGHTLCNHTMRHEPSLAYQPASMIRAELDQTNQAIAKASGGVRPYYFRPPQGRFSPTQTKVATSLGMASLGWKVTSSDWQSPLMQPGPMANWLIRSAKPGSIILFHDAGSPGTHWHTVAGLDLLLTNFHQRRLPITAL